MFDKVAIELTHEDRKLLEALRRAIMTLADSAAKLSTDIDKLIAENGPAAVAAAVSAAVAAKDASDAAVVDAIDAKVVAALPTA